MIKGLRFEIPNRSGRYLFYILNNIEVEKYYWNLSSDEVICYDEKLEEFHKDIFLRNNFSGEELNRKISYCDYYIVHIELKGYKCIDDINIKTYEDFKNSKCEIFLIVFDCSYAEIYFKNAKLLKSEFEQLYNLNMEPQYISEEELRFCLNVF